jgi:hypothetical protein
MKGRDVPVPAPIGQKLAGQRRNRWLARGAGLLASALAAVPLGGLLAYALIFIALAGGGTLGGYGAAAEAADAPWVPLASAAAAVVALAADVLIGVLVARAVRNRRI